MVPRISIIGKSIRDRKYRRFIQWFVYDSNQGKWSKTCHAMDNQPVEFKRGESPFFNEVKD
jgi:hypothetical protein